MAQKRVPVKKTDSAGAALEVGDLVRIIEIPAWLTHDLPPEEAELVLAELNAVRRIARFDGYGYAWFGDESGEWFCLLPTNLLRIADA